MQEASEKMRASAQTSNKFIDTLIAQWMKVKRTESNNTASISQHQMEEQAIENPSTQEVNRQQILRNHECLIQNLKQKLKQSQEAEASLSASLEVELRNREDFQTKLNATWETVETITEYFNYISETLASFQQHRANLSSLYDNVILKQQETVQKLHSKMKDLENQITHLRSRSLSLEERLQEATVEKNKLRKQLENFEYQLQLQKKELANTHAQEKQKLVKEQQCLLQEYESRLRIVEKEKCDITKLAAQLENKLQNQEENLQKMLTEQNKWRKQMEDTEREFSSQKDAIANTYAEEKKILVEKQQRLLSEYEDLQSQLKIMEQNKSNTADLIAQKDVLLSKLQDENSTYKNQIEVMMASNNEILSEYEALVDKQNIHEKELNAKSEKIQNMETIVSAMKQRESNLINDLNRFEKKLTNEMDYSKNLENKLSNMQKELKLAQEQNDEIQKTLEKVKTTNEQDNIELQQRLKTLHREKEDAIKRENMRIENAEILSKNMQAKHDREVSALKSSHEIKLLESRRTIDRLNEMINDIKKEKSVLNMTLTEVRAHNNKLNNNYESLVEHNEELQGRLRETTEALQMRSIEDRKELKDKPHKMEEQKQPAAQSKSQEKNTKRKYRIRFDPDIVEIPEAGHCNVSTSVDLNDDKDDKQPSSQPLLRAHSIERESQKEQEAEVTSGGRKFFKSGPGFSSQRTYAKQRRN